jgi:hypothetical protein
MIRLDELYDHPEQRILLGEKLVRSVSAQNIPHSIHISHLGWVLLTTNEKYHTELQEFCEQNLPHIDLSRKDVRDLLRQIIDSDMILC